MDAEAINKMTFTFDDALDMAGSMGTFQICQSILLSLTALIGNEILYMNFVAYVPEYWCIVPELQSLPFELQVNITFL